MTSPYFKWDWNMAAKKRDLVNLDALIKREDMQSRKIGLPGMGPIPVTELAWGKSFFNLLRKPHFQRETDDWSVDNVITLIKSYRDGHLIPAVILWQAAGNTFVIDGAHRLSAFIAWLNNDYGNGQYSQAFFKGDVPKRQREIHDECVRLVLAEGCTYDAMAALSGLQNRTEQQLAWSTNTAKAVETQWVHGTAQVAAKSFLAINQRAVPIDPTERYMIEKAQYPNVLAARAIVKGSRGYQYWEKLSSENIAKIERKGRQIFDAIFEPEDAAPESTLDLQPAGIAHTVNGLRIALDLVNVLNKINGIKISLDEDANGDATVQLLERTYAIAKCIAGDESASLSLHSSVYFWGESGNHRPSAFLAMALFIQEMIKNDELIDFTLHRAKLEEFLIGNKIVKTLLGKHGSWKKSLTPTLKSFRTIFEGFKNGKSEQEIESDILQLAAATEEDKAEFEMQTLDKNIWNQTKKSLKRQAALNASDGNRCEICKARMPFSEMSGDHKIRRVDGGPSTKANARLTHEYCNKGFAEHYNQRGLPIPEIPFPSSVLRAVA